ncbi:MAG: M23 family peptidase, partial [Flavobacteriales bacterium]|nr:M23 family peptidase [Flavobacteriales bacterium]
MKSQITTINNITLFLFTLVLFACGGSTPEKLAEVTKEIIPEYKPTMEYGINLDSFIVHKEVIKANQFLANILLKHHIPYVYIDKLAKQSDSIFNVRKMAAGKNYTILCKKDSIEKAQYFIYEPNSIDYIVYDMRDSIVIFKGEREVITKINTASGTIKSSLYQTLADANVSPVLAIEMADVFAWTIDFYRI